MKRIWAQDPPYDFPGEFRTVQLKDAIIPALGIGTMPKPFQKPRPPITMSVSSRNSPTARVAGQHGWGILSGNNMPANAVATHWVSYSKACAEAGIAARSENWRVARNIMVAPSDAEARDRVFSEQGSNRYFYTYMREVLSRVGILSVMKPDPDMPDEAATVEVITEGCALYGSPKTLLDKLVAFRDEVGPFGTLLMTGLDWSGRNGAWEREFDAASGGRGDAEIPSARDRAGGGIAAGGKGRCNGCRGSLELFFSCRAFLHGTRLRLSSLAGRKLHDQRDPMGLLRRRHSDRRLAFPYRPALIANGLGSKSCSIASRKNFGSSARSP